ncbi:MAG: glycosyltransferase family 4 protein [Fibrobacterota bacterium]|nr:glycosyltransferase family 4 protein [Fibrobacterota bacterium]
MDILIITQDFPPERGGIQTYVLELARGFMAKGHAVRVICPGSPRDENPLPALKELVRLRSPSSLLFLPLLAFLPGYLRRNPSVTHVLYAQWQCAIAENRIPASVRKRLKTFSLVHGRELLTSVFGPAAPFLMRRTFGRLDAAFPNSNEVLRLTREKIGDARQLHLVHPGVDPELFQRKDAGFLRQRYALGNAPVIVSITRMVARKNLGRLILALPDVRAAVPGTRLVLGGTGPERESLVRLAAQLGLSDTVLFTGRIADAEMAAHYSLADVFALPSLSSRKDVEGFGIVYLEAGACEVPVVGGQAGGVPDAVAHGETGLLVDPENTEKLKQALIDLLRDRDKARTLGRNARARIQKSFTWTATSERMLHLMS